jgi:RNA polymerase sigma-70 factor (ECF subfamily)
MVAVTSDPPRPLLAPAVRLGDRAAFEQLFRLWYSRLAEYALRLAGSSDAAEDAVQDVFIALWARRDAMPDDDKLTAYLHRAVRNRVLNQLRDERTAARWASTVDADAFQAPSADDELAQSDLARAIAAALDELPPRTREVFSLSRDRELTYAEIAETLGISVKTVETLMGRALRTLRERLRPV